MKVEISVQPNKKITLSSFEKFKDGSGGAFLEVKSGRFSYYNETFYFDDLARFTEELKQMYELLSGSTELRFHYESEYIKFEAKSLGHIEITGEFLEYDQIQQRLTFGFEIDQSYLPSLIRQLEIVVQEVYS
jgi:hypothetical protein